MIKVADRKNVKKSKKNQVNLIRVKKRHSKKNELISKVKIGAFERKFKPNSKDYTNINQVKICQVHINKIRTEINKVIIGQTEIVDGLIRALLSNGHVLVEGLPGIAKTVTISALSKVVGGHFSRIQFTVDLLPADIVGITSYYNNDDGRFYVIKGPIFANFVLADEINRAAPKTQSAMLEAMQEKQSTIGKKSYSMPRPFFVMATQNPIESSGTYSLPEAQIDRFMFKLLMKYPSIEEESRIIDQNTLVKPLEAFKLKMVTNLKKIEEMQKIVNSIYLKRDLKDYITKIVDATRNPEKYKITLGKYIDYGCSPRATIFLAIGAKAEAVMNGVNYVTPQFVKNVAYEVMRHRIILTYEGLARKISQDDIISEILEKVPIQ